MAESFLFELAGKVLGQLGSLAVREVSLACGVESNLEELTRTLSTIKSVLLDAEQQQNTRHALGVEHQLEDWLRNLKDVMYDMDDLLDEFHYFSLRKKVRSFSLLPDSPLFRFKMGHKLKKMRERLDLIAADRAKFNLRELQQPPVIVHRQRLTHSFVNASDVIGRDQDKETIVEHLLGSSSHNNNVSVISIVGIGGLGKTTLAKMVFNDERITNQFHQKMWVCVSNEFKAEEMMKKIIKSATAENCNELDINELQIRLRGALNGEKYLLVLDDVWNDDRVKWMELWELLAGGAEGSKIVVTTRSESVATIMGSDVTYELQGLPYDECVSLFLKWAFDEGEEKQRQKLVKIGKEIVKKCKGLTLAVRTLGSMLYKKSDEHDWLFVRDNEIWKLEQKEDDILPALKLSYNQLPSYLKPCFAYCSIFSKDTEFNYSLLIYVWMSQGYIQSSDQNQDLEGIGKSYIEELLSRSFFQEVEDDGMNVTFKMHDLIHDLALLVTKTECVIINSCANSILEKVRHVSFSNGDPWQEDLFGPLLEQRNIRSIHFQYGGAGPTRESFVETCISRFKCLRYLNLIDSSFERLPRSISDLRHLRLLNLVNNLHIKSLPNSICKLIFLQTLILDGCVKFEKLPKDMGKLINLRNLHITTQERSLAEGIGKLTSIRELSIINCGNLESLLCDNGMQHLSGLQTLCILNCGNLLSLSRKDLKHLTMLKTLIIGECETLEFSDDHLCEATAEDEDSEHQKRGGLCSLERLTIGRLPKLVVFPQWLLEDAAAAETLKSIYIGVCPNITEVVPESLVENLTSLEILRVENCPQVMSLPDGMHRLVALRELYIDECPELIRRCQRGIGEDWHKIAHIPNIYLDGEKI